MTSTKPRTIASIHGIPLHAMLVSIPLVCFTATLATDIVYWRTAAMQWANMSAWLLVVGLIGAVFAAIAGAIDYLGDRRIRGLQAGWVHVIGNAAALLLSAINVLIHTRDAYTSVVPEGLIVSAVVVGILFATGWTGRVLVYRHGVGVRSGEHV